MIWEALTTALPMVGNAIGGWISGKSQEKATQATNETNINLAEKTNAFNANEANLARNYNERMSNTAHQRQVADMKAAGLNPMLSATQGGASSPNSPMASGVTARAEAPDKRYLGDAVKSLANSALNMKNTELDLKAKETAINTQAAQALAAVAQANNANASAKATEAGMSKILAESSVAFEKAEATRAQSRLERKSAEFDLETNVLDKSIEKIGNAIGGITDAVSLKNLIKGKGPRLQYRSRVR